MRNPTLTILTILVCILVFCEMGLAQEKPRAEIVSVDIPKDIVTGQPVYVDVIVRNAGGDAKAGGISISFPDNPLVSIIYADTTKATVYPIGSPVWSNTKKKQIQSKYVLVEAWQEPWKAQEAHRFKLKVMPNVVGKLRVYVRATVTVPAQKREIIKTPETAVITDQQGFPVEVFEVAVQDVTNAALKVTINQMDASYYPDVICYVVVTDEADRPISGLTKADFSVSENNAIQTINSVSSIAVGSGDQTAPISVVLTIDESGSMSEEGKMAAAISAANKFIDLMNSDDKVFIISFSDDVKRYGNFLSSKSHLHDIVNNLATSGRTALYDAISVSITEVLKEPGRKAVISLTDGIENQSKTKYETLVEQIKQGGIPVYTVGLGNTINGNVMRQIAWDSGGRYYHVPNSADLVNLYSSISQQLHKIYVIKYTTKALLRGGTVHNVMVAVRYQGMDGQDIKGYTGVVEMR